jgi:Fibronectin type III domain
MTTLANTVFLCAAVFLTSDAVIAQTPQKSSAQSSPQFQVGVHLSRAKPDSGEPDMGAIARETADTIAGNIEHPVMTPTRSSFLAKWQRVKGATGYRLDVSTTPSFDSCVSTYRDLDAGNVSSHIVAGLNRGTKYYYRVRAYNSAGIGSSSEAVSVTTSSTSLGLVIIPTFDSTITNDPRSNAIQAMIISAIEKYQTLFSDPITVSIRFRYSGYHLEGDPMGTLIGASNSGIHQLDWNTYITALKADGKTANDMSANATLPTSALSPIMLTNSANGRAVGLNTPPVMFADGSLGIGGPYDGIITINSLKPVQFTRPVSPGNFDGQMFTEHEIDEVLGSGSHLNTPAPQYFSPIDLFSWASLNARNTSASGQRFFSIDRGLHYIVQFNQNPDGDFGDYDSDGFCPATRLYVQNAFNCDGQSTDISATSPEGISLDVIGYDLIPASTASGVLGNISTRLLVGTGDNVLIAGFIITGNGAKQLVLRAIGPTLTQFGLANAMHDPTLELHDSIGALIVSNDDWQDAPNAQSIPSNLQPPNNLESAILTTLNPGAYTAILRGYHDSVGTALVEVYDMGEGGSKLSNISTRGFVQTGDDVMIAGVIVQFHSKRVIVRALGPTLTGFGVPNALADPILEIRDVNGTLLASNDDWKDTQQNDIVATGKAPPNDFESAILGTLTPGNYTAIVRGFNNASGNALIEVYGLD